MSIKSIMAAHRWSNITQAEADLKRATAPRGYVGSGHIDEHKLVSKLDVTLEKLRAKEEKVLREYLAAMAPIKAAYEGTQ